MSTVITMESGDSLTLSAVLKDDSGNYLDFDAGTLRVKAAVSDTVTLFQLEATVSDVGGHKVATFPVLPDAISFTGAFPAALALSIDGTVRQTLSFTLRVARHA